MLYCDAVNVSETVYLLSQHHNRPRTPNPNQKSKVVRKEKKNPVDHTKVIELEKEVHNTLCVH